MRRFLLFLALVFFAVASGEAQNFKAFTPLRTIKTEHFEIIFPRESAVTAETLAAFADSSYERISSLLGVSLKARVPVVITPHTDEFNGYMNPLPYPHIVLFDTPMDGEWTGFENSLESLFFHELTHAVSLNSRGRFFEVLHSIFGGWVYPTGLTAPMFMVEGVAVSFESLDGFGRANDPLIKEKLRQAIHENQFLTGFQASGVYDFPPLGNAYYDYGGLFSAWLQKTYGMEKYAELWEAMGRTYHFSFFFYRSGYYNGFKKTYGIEFEEAWNLFKESLRLPGIEENSRGFVYGEPFRGGQAGKILIRGMAAGGGRVLALDQGGKKIIAFDPVSGKAEKLAPADSGGYHIAAGEDGRFLVSSYRYRGSLARAVVTERDREGRKTGRSWPGLYSAGYFRDGVIGRNSEGHVSSLVYRSTAGRKGEETEEILLKGNEELLYSRAATVDENWIAFTVLKKGKRELCLFNYRTRKVYTLYSDLSDDRERWQYIRGLEYSRGRLFFSFNHDDRMYKLGAADVSALGGGDPEDAELEAVFTDRDFSGGVFSPVPLDGAVYYRGAFSTWDALMRYLERAEELSGVKTALRLKPWSGEDRMAAGLPPWPDETVLPQEPAAVPEQPEAILPESKPYVSLKYFNPFKLWIPLPLFHIEEGKPFIDGGGFFSFMTDPAEANKIFLQAYMDARSLMGVFDLRWTNLSLGLPLEITFYDGVDRTWGYGYRKTRATVTGTFIRGIGGEWLKLSLTAGLGLSWFAFDPGGGSRAYTWQYSASGRSVILGTGLSSLSKNPWQIFGQGFSAAFYSRFSIPELEARYEGLLQAAFEPFPLRFGLYGAWDPRGMNLAGFSPAYDTSLFDGIAPQEYSVPESSGFKWLAGGEIELRIFSAEIQRSLSHLYYNRIFGTLSYRGAVYNGEGVEKPAGNLLGDGCRLVQSAVLRFGGAVSTVFITALPVKAIPQVWGAFKISGLKDGLGWDDFAAGFTFSIEL
jgi:hypothetical protein